MCRSSWALSLIYSASHFPAQSLSGECLDSWLRYKKAAFDINNISQDSICLTAALGTNWGTLGVTYDHYSTLYEPWLSETMTSFSRIRVLWSICQILGETLRHLRLLITPTELFYHTVGHFLDPFKIGHTNAFTINPILFFLNIISHKILNFR